MKIRKATLDDKDNIIKLYEDVIENMYNSPFTAYWEMGIHPTEKLIADSIKNETMFILEDNTLLSAMILNSNGTADYENAPWRIKAKKEEALVLHLLAIAPKEQGKGVGSIMVENAISCANEKGVKALRLDVIKTNLPAIHLYEKHGFIKIEDYKEEISEKENLDFVLYEKPLSDKS